MIFSLAEKAKMYATVAQSVEQLIRNQQVAGSSPASSSNKKRLFLGTFFYCTYWSARHRRSAAVFSILFIERPYGKFSVRAFKFYGWLKRNSLFVKGYLSYIFAFTLRFTVDYGDNRLI